MIKQITKIHLRGHLLLAFLSIWSVIFLYLLAGWTNTIDHLIRFQLYHYILFIILIFLFMQIVESAHRFLSVVEYE